MNLLFLSRWYPYPVDNGSKIRIFNLLKHLSARHNITLLSFCQEPVSTADLAAMGQYCHHVEALPYIPFKPGGLKAKLALFSPKPRSVIDTFSPQMAGRVTELAEQNSFEAIIASQIDMVPYAQLVSGPPKILEELELATYREQFLNQTNLLKRLRYGLTWYKQRRYARQLGQAFKIITAVSEAETGLLKAVVGPNVRVATVPNGVDCAQNSPDNTLPEPNTLIYSGALSFYANFDAMDYFLSQIFPLILAQQPQTRLSITGKTGGVALEKLAINPQVTFTGYLEEIQPAIRKSWLSIVPLRLGGGTRLKILESLALGTPVVATAKGAEGLNLVHGEDILIADTPAEFASATLRLLNDPDLRQTLSLKGRNKVLKLYDWQQIGADFCELVDSAAVS